MRANVFLIFAFVLPFLCNVQSLEDNESPEFEDDEDYQDLMNGWQVKPQSMDDVPGLTEDMLAESIQEAKKETEEEEKRIPRVNRQDEKAEMHTQQSHYKRFNPELEPARQGALIMERTTKRLASKLGLSHTEAARKLEGLQSNHLKELDKLQADEDESPAGNLYSEYRTIDGLNNNPRNPNNGRANSPFTRVLRPSYADGISTPRRAKNGGKLPNARKVSSLVFKDVNRESRKLSHMAMIWGQFIDHDVNLGAQPNIDCSGSCGLAGECFGIRVPRGDTPFRQKGKTCIQLKRDVPAVKNGAPISPREQVNVITSFIDASQIYGSNERVFEDLRLEGTPFLRVMKNPAGRRFKDLLPKREEGFCRTTNPTTMPCFKAGDERTNENPGLGSMHTIWLREHNRIATELKKLNPHWSAKDVFFEARKIVGAMVQHITYNEFLPLILNRYTRRRFKLILNRRFFRGYDRGIDASVFNAFSAAAYRFGHSLVRNYLSRFARSYRQIRPRIPMNRFDDPTFLYQTNKGGVDSIVRGLAKDKAQNVDIFFAKTVQEQLVRFENDLADLPALNIQRGREHGIPGYNQYRKLVGLRKARRFSGFTNIPFKKRKTLKKVYRHADDVDLFVGGMYERPLRGAALGRTFSFLIAEQFRRFRLGDRFWYENPGQFTSRQLKEIKRETLAKVICRNGDNIGSIQRYALRVQRGCLSRTRCKRLVRYSINLKRWQSYPWFK